jgi:hypothetical protein
MAEKKLYDSLIVRWSKAQMIIIEVKPELLRCVVGCQTSTVKLRLKLEFKFRLKTKLKNITMLTTGVFPGTPFPK